MPTARRARSPSQEDALRGLVLHPQQDELLLADRLPLFDQDVALGEGVEVLVHPAAGLVAQPRGDLRLMSQGRPAIDPVGDKLEQNLAEYGAW